MVASIGIRSRTARLALLAVLMLSAVAAATTTTANAGTSAAVAAAPSAVAAIAPQASHAVGAVFTRARDGMRPALRTGWWGCSWVAWTAAAIVWGAGWYWVARYAATGFRIVASGVSGWVSTGIVAFILNNWNFTSVDHAMRWVYNC